MTFCVPYDDQFDGWQLPFSVNIEPVFMYLQGTIAYVPQQAWIQNLTLRDNVLFGKPYVKSTYQIVLSNCCLQNDLKLLAGGDMTEIGERVRG